VTAAAACARSMLRSRGPRRRTRRSRRSARPRCRSRKSSGGDDHLVARPMPSSSRALHRRRSGSERRTAPPKRSDSAFSNAATRAGDDPALRSVSATAAIMVSSMVGRAKGRKLTRSADQEDPGDDKGDADQFLRVSDSPNRYQLRPHSGRIRSKASDKRSKPRRATGPGPDYELTT